MDGISISTTLFGTLRPEFYYFYFFLGGSPKSTASWQSSGVSLLSTSVLLGFPFFQRPSSFYRQIVRLRFLEPVIRRIISSLIFV
jgi:hypothetical protein